MFIFTKLLLLRRLTLEYLYIHRYVNKYINLHCVFENTGKSLTSHLVFLVIPFLCSLLYLHFSLSLSLFPSMPRLLIVMKMWMSLTIAVSFVVAF